MATLYQSPYFLTFPSAKILLLEHHNFIFNTHYFPLKKDFKFRIYAAKKARGGGGGRKVKSNIELCNDIKEFIASVGLPQGHVPSIKELSAHGRNDLAYIVRRRGYKAIGELLTSSVEVEVDGFNVDERLDEGKETIASDVDTSTEGQDVKVEDVVEDSSLSTEFPILGRSSSISMDRKFNSSEVPMETSSISMSWIDRESDVLKSLEVTAPSSGLSHSEYEDIEVQNEVEKSSILSSFVDAKSEDDDREHSSTVEDKSVTVKASIRDGSHSSLNDYTGSNSQIQACVTTETFVNSSFERESSISKDEDEMINSIPEDVSLRTEVSNMEYSANDSNINLFTNSTDHSFASVGLAANSSLEDKVAKFIQSGDLDIIGDNIYGASSERAEESSVRAYQTDFQPQVSYEENDNQVIYRSNASLALNGSVSASEDMNLSHRNDDFSTEDLAISNLDEESDNETNKRGNEVEINDLRLKLHQKEMELTRLKEQIEKEKLALSNLQTKAEMEIRKAQKMISKKDAELLAAEESLSGLVEVNIQYHGDGETVEVAGSFNGWHHRIKLDPQPANVIDSSGSRKSKLWSAILWLYPGVYEIKFIVDGHWKIDPEGEIVNQGGISNNILRVVA